MTADPQEPETFRTVFEAARSAEVPEEDAAEERAALVSEEDGTPSRERGTEYVDPADAAEQERVVELDEEDYR
ncbi:hypothetical protein ACFQLX_16925 [Streptomyces polyrhachis]|uniref:DUF5709 domain-containing protein n=1 Tax=Streptomyces polyrhachis TaxID=1282885 RepID=A0ABW2GGQ5_9ACTN